MGTSEKPDARLRKMQLALKCIIEEAHGLQKRKYTNAPYFEHLLSVARTARFYGISYGYEIGLCHDVLEDTKMTAQELRMALVDCGYNIYEADFIRDAVKELTDWYTKERFPFLNRKQRKTLEAHRLWNISPTAQSVKYCDLIDNTSTIKDHDPEFWKVYKEEKILILSEMNKGDKDLFNQCQRLVLIEEHLI